MPLDRTTVRRHLNENRFEDLFIEELGWDEATTPPLDITIDDVTYLLRPIAQKRGVIALALHQSPLPAYALRRKIETQVAKRYREHIIIYVDEAGGEQVWQWVRLCRASPCKAGSTPTARGKQARP
jgi:hypothetical protein